MFCSLVRLLSVTEWGDTISEDHPTRGIGLSNRNTCRRKIALDHCGSFPNKSTIIPTFGLDRPTAHGLSGAPNASANGKTSGFATRPSSRADVPTVVANGLAVPCIIGYSHDTGQALTLADNGSGEGFLREIASLRPKQKTRPFAAAVFVQKCVEKVPVGVVPSKVPRPLS